MLHNLLAARAQMAISLGFHIVFAAIGVAMPFLVATAHYKWLRSGDPIYQKLTQAWSKGVAILFATGAVSGTVLSFELGLLWPRFMEHAGPIIGMPFSWEGAAFFLEAIAIGVFLYGWGRLHPWLHWAAGLVVGISGIFSALFVICANGWMNSPAGFRWQDGHATNIDPWAAMWNRAALGQGIHMCIAAFVATAVAVAGLHAWGLRKSPQSGLHRAALRISLGFAAVAALVQPLHGDRLAKSVAVRQPIKLAAMEALFETAAPAPLLLGGLPDAETQTVRYGLHIPRALSFLAFGDLSSPVRGLAEFRREHWPPVAIVHLAFQLMVAIGSLLFVLALPVLWLLWRAPQRLEHPRCLWLMMACTPLGFLAIEAGWTVTEVGRQPWIIYGVLKTADAVTPMPGVIVPLLFFSVLYLGLSLTVIWLLRRQLQHVA